MTDTTTINGRDYRCTTTRKAPLAGAMFGLLLAVVAGTVGIFFIWLPPIAIAAFVSALALLVGGPLVFGVLARKGPCPNCNRTTTAFGSRAMRCAGCRHTIALRDGKLVDLA